MNNLDNEYLQHLLEEIKQLIKDKSQKQKIIEKLNFITKWIKDEKY